MGAALRLGELRIDVVRKDIRNVHLSVHPPQRTHPHRGPPTPSDAAVRAFAIGKLGWIRKQQRKLQEQERETPREYLDRETHFVWGRRCLPQTLGREAPAQIASVATSATLARLGARGITRGSELADWWKELSPVLSDFVHGGQGQLAANHDTLVPRYPATWFQTTMSIATHARHLGAVLGASGRARARAGGHG